jgi:hypothetical protein
MLFAHSLVIVFHVVEILQFPVLHAAVSANKRRQKQPEYIIQSIES